MVQIVECECSKVCETGTREPGRRGLQERHTLQGRYDWGVVDEARIGTASCRRNSGEHGTNGSPGH